MTQQIGASGTPGKPESESVRDDPCDSPERRTYQRGEPDGPSQEQPRSNLERDVLRGLVGAARLHSPQRFVHTVVLDLGEEVCLLNELENYREKTDNSAGEAQQQHE